MLFADSASFAASTISFSFAGPSGRISTACLSATANPQTFRTRSNCLHRREPSLQCLLCTLLLTGQAAMCRVIIVSQECYFLIFMLAAASGARATSGLAVRTKSQTLAELQGQQSLRAGGKAELNRHFDFGNITLSSRQG